MIVLGKINLLTMPAAHYPDHNIKYALRKIGFSENEIKVLNFLFHRQKSPLEKISQYTAISKSSTLFTLSNLENRQLVTRDGHDFEICDTVDFFQWIDEREKKHKDIYDQASNDLQDFLSLLHENSWKPSIEYYEGRDQIIELYRDMLDTAAQGDKKIYSWVDIQKNYESVGEDYVQEHVKKRTSLGIETFNILPKNSYSLKHMHDKFRNVKFVKELPLNGDLRIYGDKVAVITFAGKEPVGFVFEGRIITNMFKTIFDNAWASLPSEEK